MNQELQVELVALSFFYGTKFAVCLSGVSCPDADTQKKVVHPALVLRCIFICSSTKRSQIPLCVNAEVRLEEEYEPQQ